VAQFFYYYFKVGTTEESISSHATRRSIDFTPARRNHPELVRNGVGPLQLDLLPLIQLNESGRENSFSFVIYSNNLE